MIIAATQRTVIEVDVGVMYHEVDLYPEDGGGGLKKGCREGEGDFLQVVEHPLDILVLDMKSTEIHAWKTV